MLRVPLSYARAGMRLALPVFHPQREDTVLLTGGIELDDRLIGRLRELRIREFWIDFPQTEEICQWVNPGVLQAQAALTRQIGHVFDDVSSGTSLDASYPAFRDSMSGMLSKLLDCPEAAIFMQQMAAASSPALRHSSNTCFLSVLMGLRLENYLIKQRMRLSPNVARDVSDLGVGAMLHDIGMLRLEDSVVDRWKEDGNENDSEWREHVRIGYEMVQGIVPAPAAAAVLHHHQRYDGSGFPYKQGAGGAYESLAGEDIHVFARIIAAADLFDRLRHEQSVRIDVEDGPPTMPVVRALRLMLGEPYCKWIDPTCMKALIAVAPPYSPGTMVRLNNGITGVVYQWNPEDPCRPIVTEATGLPGIDGESSTPGRMWDLRESQQLRIVEVDGEDVSGDNFFPTNPGEFVLESPDMGIDVSTPAWFMAPPKKKAESKRKAG